MSLIIIEQITCAVLWHSTTIVVIIIIIIVIVITIALVILVLVIIIPIVIIMMMIVITSAVLWHALRALFVGVVPGRTQLQLHTTVPQKTLF